MEKLNHKMGKSLVKKKGNEHVHNFQIFTKTFEQKDKKSQDIVDSIGYILLYLLDNQNSWGPLGTHKKLYEKKNWTEIIYPELNIISFPNQVPNPHPPPPPGAVG